MSPNLLDPDKLPLLMGMSVVASLAIGMIVYNVTDDWELAALIALFLIIADYIGLTFLMKRRDK